MALTPTAVTLYPSQTQTFTTTVTNASNTAVTWSLSPAVGSISAAGLYTAPASIANAQTVIVTATSVADSTISASASISLSPPISVALTPTTGILEASQTQAFTATVSNTSNTAVTWSLSPAVGSISTAGLYTAPASIPTEQTITVTATSVADSTKSASASMSLVVPTLSINTTSVAFGNVVVNTPATQSVTLTSTGSGPVTINSVVVTGAGFAVVSWPTSPVTLNPTQTATLLVQFEPTVTGSATGQLTIASTSTTNGTAILGLSGTGDHEVDLSWNAPSSSVDPVAGYSVYRSSNGGSTYQLLNSSVDTATTYADTTVLAGLTYQYNVESVDASGYTSVPSNTISETVP